MKYDKIYIVAPVAQWIEQYRPKVMVEGSTPFRSATLFVGKGENRYLNKN